MSLHFARQDGQDRKKRKENHATKVTKIPKTKRRKYGMNETLSTCRYVIRVNLIYKHGKESNLTSSVISNLCFVNPVCITCLLNLISHFNDIAPTYSQVSNK